MTLSRFLGLRPPAEPEEADVLLLPLPFERTACYGKGTAKAPESIWHASTHIEDWDEEIGFNLSSLTFHSASPVAPTSDEETGEYIQRVSHEAARLRQYDGLVIGVGGEHSLTPPLVRAALGKGIDPTTLTVVQFDAHADLRDAYEGTGYSHACAMRRLVEEGIRVVAIGIRSAEEQEMKFGVESGLVDTYYAHELARSRTVEDRLHEQLGSLAGPVYVTFDIDGLEVNLCPATGTPLPGGLGWWQALGYLYRLLGQNRKVELVGADVVETVPVEGSQVNEVVAARLICKILAYWFSSR